MDNLISTKEVCKILNVSGCTLARWCRVGKVGFTTTPGGHRRYNVSEIERVKPILSFGNRLFSKQEPVKIIEVSNVDKQFCKCGCGREAPKATRNWHNKGIKKGQYLDFICGHHRRGKQHSVEEKIKRVRKWGCHNFCISPFLTGNKVARFSDKDKRWHCCHKAGSRKTHASLVYKQFFGEVPDGYVVHHKSGQCSKIEDDHPNNLLAVPNEWNRNYFPWLAKGFGVPEKIVTDCYVELVGKCCDEELFPEVCRKLLEKTRPS